MLALLTEIRHRLLCLFFTFTGFFFLFFYFSEYVFRFLMSALVEALPGPSPLIATQITSPLITPLHVAMNTALLACSPIMLWHVWQFIAPALYHHEQKLLKKTLISSLFLFISGLVFGFYVILPCLFLLFSKAVPTGVQFLPDIASSIDFITHTLLMFGLFFQIPLICTVLVELRLLSLTALKNSRPYVIVMSFILGMLLTPPDVLSQILVAAPLCLLYELGIISCKFSKRHKLSSKHSQ